ncbi:hypothetical protein CSUB01_07883 [Colletotrichum sublineola]|uniref:Uncharacterized protein n=1 Tax=Colletotrichum sublineola TaxID=1173701 RepID=A0A066XBS7_COLSU|nr:hypothetical protein CSUB01_07883 [Colletotrichum sublineola]
MSKTEFFSRYSLSPDGHPDLADRDCVMATLDPTGDRLISVPTPLRQLALAWPGRNRVGALDGRSAFYYSAALNRLLTLWGSRPLHTLHVVVDPVQLRDAEKPWPTPADRSWAT